MRRNDDIALDEIVELRPQYLVIGPDPCSPKEAGISVLPSAPLCRADSHFGRVPRPLKLGGRIVRAKADARQSIARVPHQ